MTRLAPARTGGPEHFWVVDGREPGGAEAEAVADSPRPSRWRRLRRGAGAWFGLVVPTACSSPPPTAGGDEGYKPRTHPAAPDLEADRLLRDWATRLGRCRAQVPADLSRQPPARPHPGADEALDRIEAGNQALILAATAATCAAVVTAPAAWVGLPHRECLRREMFGLAADLEESLASERRALVAAPSPASARLTGRLARLDLGEVARGRRALGHFAAVDLQRIAAAAAARRMSTRDPVEGAPSPRPAAPAA